MATRNANLFIDGTAALDMHTANAARTAHIVAFPQKAPQTKGSARIVAFPQPAPHPESAPSNSAAPASLNKRAARILLGSEMYCSLIREDFRGVAYGIFSHANIRTLAAAGFVVAALALAFGA